jgi:mannose-6-phosphate isomerase-like protein (cupin superfamily)
MSDYTKTNMMGLANILDGRVEGVEARFARDPSESEHLGVSHFRFAPGVRAPFGHHHKEQEEVYLVIEGSGRVKLGDEILDLAQWDVLRVAPSVVRAFEGGPDGMAYVAVGSDRPEGGDGEMVQDFWVD